MNRYVIALVALVVLVAAGAAVWLLIDGKDGTTAESEASAPAPEPSADPETDIGDGLESAIVDPDLAALLDNAAEQINAEAPIRIDEITTLTRARARGRRIRYRYDVAQEVPADRLEANRARMTETTRRDVCSNATDREIIEAGAEVEFAYYGPDGDHYFSTVVDRC
ncbi:MAG: hypothetical protein RLN87_03210 [Parasphingopyxis sp.]|uniref:hypothetical protein n=1 Tax=Parasphingopyxis sp. TaxID=1920299 RepID=UPI0032ECE517